MVKNCRKFYLICLKKIVERKIIKLIKKIEKENTKFVKIDVRIVANKIKKFAKLINDMQVKVINDEIIHIITEYKYKKRLKQEA